MKLFNMLKNVFLLINTIYWGYYIIISIGYTISEGYNEKVITILIISILIISTMYWIDYKIDEKKHQKILNKKRRAKIDKIYNEIAEQDRYLNKQIVTRQYREQKAKKDGK